MKRIPGVEGVGLIVLLLLIAACVQEVGRGNTPTLAVSVATPVPTSTFTPAPYPTPPPPPSPTRAPNPSLTPAPTKALAPKLVLDVRAPRDGSTVRTDAVVVHGVTLPGALIDIGGVTPNVGPDGKFQAEIRLVPGINIIRVLATDAAGNSESTVLNVTSLVLPPQPFLLLVTEPKDQSIVSRDTIRLSGRTGPQAIASVNGVFVPVDELGFFFAVLVLDPGPNIIDIVATNDDGRVLSTVIAVIYRP